MGCLGLFVMDKRYIMLLVTLGITYLSTIFVIVSLCTNHWVELRDRNLYDKDVMVHFGLHRVCWVSSGRCNNAGNDYDQQNTLPAVQGLVIAGGFLTVIVNMLNLINIFRDRLGLSSTLMCAFCAIMSVISGVLLMVGIILFAIKVEVRSEYLGVGYTDFQGYSFGLATTAAILMLIAGILSGCTGLSQATPKFLHQMPTSYAPNIGSYPPSVANYPPSVVNYPPSVVNYPPSVTNYPDMNQCPPYTVN